MRSARGSCEALPRRVHERTATIHLGTRPVVHMAMMPGYVDAGGFDPYISPIRITEVKPKKTGAGLLRVRTELIASSRFLIRVNCGDGFIRDGQLLSDDLRTVTVEFECYLIGDK